ncbi:tRNA delta(2)-isopentenylpyrophosphate transferase [Niabella soli DSM 19437]|uniref:tRNA dimethylallyltransferase n=1 Tax=Niabella soli DSM 19437 TaxID=929713 RepID=W0EYI3_9BACT|nr:tRNA delta(2)-isopentenylpyrophosphate transferase [Niabella soli DSM 19437]
MVIAGPTAVGKTATAIEAANYFNTVILSADSRQCYKELNIGVARPSAQELKAAPHYFIASHSVHDTMNAALYETYALGLLRQLFVQHPVIVAVGGTGLYLKALLEGMDPIPPIPETIRQTIVAAYNTKGIDWLKAELEKKDPLFFAKGEMQNPQRMMRALEIMEGTGQSILEYQKKNKKARFFDALCIGLELPRAVLYERINERVLAMMNEGLEKEAKSLLPLRTVNALQTVGYQELFQYFDGMLTQTAAVALIQQNTRHYAKRQLTWFKKQQDLYWLNAARPQIVPLILSAIKEKEKN